MWGPSGQDRAHGCRCDPCRDANNTYARYSAKRVRLNRSIGDWARPYVPPGRALAHIDALRAQGIGYRRIADLAGIATSGVGDIISGRSKQIRHETEAAILAVTPRPAPSTFVAGGPTWQLIDELLAAGVTKKRIGQAITGNPDTASLQLRRDRIEVRSAERVAALHHHLLSLPPAPYVCTCGVDLGSLEEWRSHNDSLNGRYAGHRLTVNQQEAAG